VLREDSDGVWLTTTLLVSVELTEADEPEDAVDDGVSTAEADTLRALDADAPMEGGADMAAEKEAAEVTDMEGDTSILEEYDRDADGDIVADIRRDCVIEDVIESDREADRLTETLIEKLPVGDCEPKGEYEEVGDHEAAKDWVADTEGDRDAVNVGEDAPEGVVEAETDVDGEGETVGTLFASTNTHRPKFTVPVTASRVRTCTALWLTQEVLAHVSAAPLITASFSNGNNGANS
jgi:hypothetical protein